MKIQVGNTYINAKGDYVEIVRHDDGHQLPYVDADGNGYTEDGYFPPRNLPEYEPWNLIDEA